MKTYVYTLFCFLSLLLFTACGDDDNSPIAPVLGSRTVLVYMAADNNLVGFAYNDLDEMKQGMRQVVGEDIHFLVYMDFGTQVRLVELKNENGQVKEVLLKQYATPRNSIGFAETAEVFRDAFTAFPAESYGLVYWSHGDGWIPANVNTKWIGQDSSNGFMNLSDFVLALQEVPHLDFLLFDACFMQGIEVAYEMRSFTDALVCSPTETPAPGAPYQKIVPAMFIQEPALNIAKAYYNYYSSYYVEPNAGEIRYSPWNSNNDWISGLSMSVVKLDNIQELANLTLSLLTKANFVDLQTLRKLVSNYDKRNNCLYYDFYSLMKQLLSSDDFITWRSLFDNVCVYWATTPYNFSTSAKLFSMADTHGVSHYIPTDLSSGALQAYRQTAWYQAAGLSQLGW